MARKRLAPAADCLPLELMQVGEKLGLFKQPLTIPSDNLLARFALP
jgi:hypothetical protein